MPQECVCTTRGEWGGGGGAVYRLAPNTSTNTTTSRHAAPAPCCSQRVMPQLQQSVEVLLMRSLPIQLTDHARCSQLRSSACPVPPPPPQLLSPHWPPDLHGPHRLPLACACPCVNCLVTTLRAGMGIDARMQQRPSAAPHRNSGSVFLGAPPARDGLGRAGAQARIAQSEELDERCEKYWKTGAARSIHQVPRAAAVGHWAPHAMRGCCVLLQGIGGRRTAAAAAAQPRAPSRGWVGEGSPTQHPCPRPPHVGRSAGRLCVAGL